MLNEKEIKLLDCFLEELSEQMGSACCNDWNFPSTWAEREKLDFVKEYHAYNGDPEEFLPTRLLLPDFCALALLRKHLRGDFEYRIKVSDTDVPWLVNYLTGSDLEKFKVLVNGHHGPYTIEFDCTGVSEVKRVYSYAGFLGILE